MNDKELKKELLKRWPILRTKSPYRPESKSIFVSKNEFHNYAKWTKWKRKLEMVIEEQLKLCGGEDFSYLKGLKEKEEMGKAHSKMVKEAGYEHKLLLDEKRGIVKNLTTGKVYYPHMRKKGSK